MQHSDNIFLIGPMGVGKTTIGRLLASESGLAFHDSDREIESRTGADIPWIFDVEGEEGFRVRERKIIDKLTQCQGIVLATGGGAILTPDNRQRLRERGVVVYLKASLAQQYERTAKDRNRPLLQTSDPERRIRELMTEREPLYLDTAHIVVNTTRRNPRAVVSEIRRRVRQHREDEDAKRTG